MDKKQLHLFLWKKDTENTNHFILDEYVYESIPSDISEIISLVNGNNIKILIGKNPSKAKGIVSDETNMYLKNKLFEDENITGYILLNLFSEIKTVFDIKDHNIDLEYICKQTNFLKKFQDTDIILFYGSDAVADIRKKRYDKNDLKKIDEYISEIKKHNLLITKYKNKFVHPARPGVKGRFEFSEPENENWALTCKELKSKNI